MDKVEEEYRMRQRIGRVGGSEGGGRVPDLTGRWVTLP